MDVHIVFPEYVATEAQDRNKMGRLKSLEDPSGTKRQRRAPESPHMNSSGVPRFVLKSWWVIACLMLVCSLFYWLDGCSPIFSVGYVRLPGSLPSERERPANPGFVVDTAGCRIPALDPMDAHVLPFVYKEKAIECGKDWPPQLVASNGTALLLDASLAGSPHYNVTPEELRCCYRPLWRGDDDDDSYVLSSNCTTFEGNVTVDEEFVRVECRDGGGRRIYKDFHAFVPRKPAVEQRCAAAAVAAGAVADRVSVLVVGVDAVSRLNMHRLMPRTLALMRRLNAVEMLGYNKVGDNTFPNIVPVLAGMSEAELRRACWPTDHHVFDDCPWIWKNFSEAGYRTAFAEDAPWMGVFNYVKNGFRRQPTDYYGRTVQRLAENEIGRKKLMNAKLCIGTQLTLQFLLAYVSKFVSAMASSLSFGFFWTASLTHDFLNFPQLGDEHYEQFFRRHLEAGDLDRTVVVFMSDHGIRWGSIRETYQGRLEERLPFLMFAFPRWFAERYGGAVANMRRNARRLTTPYDLHETLRDLLDPRHLQEARMRARSSAVDPSVRGRSLFLPGVENRTCAQAGVDAHWCTCQTSEPMNATDERVARAADVLVRHLNTLLKDYGECETLELVEVRDAQRQLPTADLRHSHAVADYVLVVRTRPGDAIFEATVRQRGADEQNMTVEGAVSRINMYGDQSACVADFHMKLYCYCRSYLESNAVS